MSDHQLDQKAAIVLAGVERISDVEGFPVTDFALVAETDLDLEEVRDLLWKTLADSHLDVVPGDDDGSARVTAVRSRSS
jgi:hypothetical protein